MSAPSALSKADLPQELRLNRIADYAAANHYLAHQFISDFNRRFTIKPAQPESAFVKLPGVELELVLSSKHERIVRNDNTVTYKNLILQLPTTRQRIHFVRCPVIVHQFADEVFEYIELFYNRQRRHSALGYSSPDEFEHLASKQGCSQCSACTRSARPMQWILRDGAPQTRVLEEIFRK